jgi:Putative bacterial sensory transduction regulator
VSIELERELRAHLTSGEPVSLDVVDAIVRRAGQTARETGETDTLALALLEHLAGVDPGSPEVGSLLLRVGALVEGGADPDELAPAFVGRLGPAVEAFAEVVREGGDRAGGHGIELSAAAILSRCHEARRLVREQPELLAVCRALRWELRFLHRATHLLDEEEELLVLDPGGDQPWGARMRCSGISDNAQLHALLAHVLGEARPDAGWTPPGEAALACFQGRGPQEEQGTFDAVWDLFTWTAVLADGASWSLPQDKAALTHRVWDEGVPADILPCPLLEGCRVLVLGPPATSRGLPVGRDFAALPAMLEVIDVLDAEAAGALLARLAEVPLEDRLELLEAHSEEIRVDLIRDEEDGEQGEDANAWAAYGLLREFLEDTGHTLEPIPDSMAVRFWLTSEAFQRLRASAWVFAEHEQVVFYLELPLPIPGPRQAAAAEFLTRANYDLRVGNFELDLIDGQARFKSSLDFEDTELETTTLKNLLAPACAAVDRYGPGLSRVVSGAEPAAAIAVCEG